MKAFEKRQKAKECLDKAAKVGEKAASENRLRTDEEKAEIAALTAQSKAWITEAEEDESIAGQLSGESDRVPAATAHDRFEDDPMRGFKSPREFMLSVITAGKGGRIPDNLKSLTAGSDEQGGYDNTYGGFLVPQAMAPGILQLKPEDDPIAGRVQNLPMSAPKVGIAARVDNDHSTSVSGGFIVYRRAETQTVTATRGQHQIISLQADTLMGVAYASEEILTDSPVSFAAIIESGFRDAFTFKLMNERLSGNGVGQFMGILNSPCLISVAAEDSQTADTINGTNIIKMRARCYGYDKAIWTANPDTYVQLANAHIAGTNTDNFLFNPSRAIDVPDMLLGRPVIWSEYAKKLGDAGDLILADWSQYLEGTYQPIQNASSVHVRFLEHEQTFKMWLRNCGAPWWNTTLTPVNSTSVLSPFVVLAER